MQFWNEMLLFMNVVILSIEIIGLKSVEFLRHTHAHKMSDN